MGGSFKDSPLDLVVYSPHRSGFQEAGDGETKGGDTVQLSFSNLSVCGLICDSRGEGGGDKYSPEAGRRPRPFFLV